MSDLAAVITAIASMDRTDLDAVFDSCRKRSRELRDYAAIANKASMTPGTRVVTQNLTPKSLNGMHGTVADGPARRVGDLLVIVDEADRTGRERYISAVTGQIGVPAACLREES